MHVDVGEFLLAIAGVAGTLLGSAPDDRHP